MEFKKKTIIWEDNNEPPKDYIWVKSDGKAYEYSYSQRKWIESKSINGSGGGEPIEVNPTIEDGDMTTPLNALKIGESVYTVGCGSDSDIQIVELTYDHIPETGTLSASDLAKLDSDNCLLVMNGKYFRKTFSSDGGIDYKEIGLTTVLGGVRSIYFTVSKPDGEYTIAYTYPVEANTQTQANATLETIKVGNTTYSVPKVVVIEGVYYSGVDSPIAFNDQRKESFVPTLSEGETYASVFDEVNSLLCGADVPTLVFVHYYYYDDGDDETACFSQIVGGGYDDSCGSYLSLNGGNNLLWVRGNDGPV